MKFRQDRNSYVNELKKIEEEFENRLLADLAVNCEQNPKKWWCVSRCIFQRKNECCPSLQLLVNDEVIDDDKGKAECFNKHFLEASNLDDSSALLPSEMQYLTRVSLSSCVVTETDVIAALRRLNPNKAYGCDGKSPIILRETAFSIARPLQIP